MKAIIINYEITAIDSEEIISLPTHTVDWAIRLRNPSDTVKLAFTSGESGTNYMTLDSTIPAYNAEDVETIHEKLYVQSSDTNPELEIVAHIR